LDGGRLVEPVVAGGDETTVVGVETWGVELDDGVVVLVGEPSVSGLTQPAGGADVPACPGTSTVPAQPKFDKMVSSVTIEPSGRVYCVFCSRMYPSLSTEIHVVFPENPLF
jgi:hypothetical protein